MLLFVHRMARDISRGMILENDISKRRANRRVLRKRFTTLRLSLTSDRQEITSARRLPLRGATRATAEGIHRIFAFNELDVGFNKNSKRKEIFARCNRTLEIVHALGRENELLMRTRSLMIAAKSCRNYRCVRLNGV